MKLEQAETGTTLYRKPARQYSFLWPLTWVVIKLIWIGIVVLAAIRR